MGFCRHGKEPGGPAGKVWGKILVPYPIESALSGVMKPFFPNERLWYRRTFQLPEAWRGQRILLHFGAVDWQCNVWVNGRDLGGHCGGYDAFTFNVTAALPRTRHRNWFLGPRSVRRKLAPARQTVAAPRRLQLYGQFRHLANRLAGTRFAGSEHRNAGTCPIWRPGVETEHQRARRQRAVEARRDRDRR